MTYDLWGMTATVIPLTASLLLDGKPRRLAWLLCLVPVAAVVVHDVTGLNWALPIGSATTVLSSLFLLLWASGYTARQKLSLIAPGLIVLGLTVWIVWEAAATLEEQNPDFVVCVDPALQDVGCAIDRAAVRSFALSLWGLLVGSVFGALAEAVMLAVLVRRCWPQAAANASPPSTEAS
ncbi:MAG: hypothetical protein ACOY3L_02445 [Pseudomonadota bacterium]